MGWCVDIYADADGSVPVERFLDGLPKKQRAKVLALIKQLELYGPDLPFPYSSQVRGKLRELRTQFGKTRLRVLYFADVNRVFILLHGLIKDTEKLEEADIRKAEERMTRHDRRLRKG